MKKVSRLFLLTLVLATVPVAAAFHQDTGTGDGGSGSTTCARQCPDGSWSSIACNTGEEAYCTCTGSPLMANPSCK